MAHKQNCIGFVCTCNDSVFTEGNRIRNKYSLDIDVIISEVSGASNDAIWLYVLYWNRLYNRLVSRDVDEIRILKKDFGNWTKVEE